MTTLLQSWGDRRDDEREPGLGPSDIDRCLRRSGYIWHDVPKPTDEPFWAARFGSLLHLGWSQVIRDGGDPLHVPDVPIRIPGLARLGHADDVDYRARVVNDLKTLNARAWEWWLVNGPRDSAWDQVELYAYGLWMAEDADDSITAPSRPPWTLAITALNRETGEEARFERAADPERGARLTYRLIERQRALEESNAPSDLPQEGAGPGRGFPCDWCPWVAVCWPEPDDELLSPQAAAIADDPEAIAQVGEDYLAAHAAWGKLDKAKKDARVFLQGIPPGQYGDVVIRWQGGNDLGPEPDPDAMIERLRDLGQPIPTRERQSARSIRVGRAAPAAASLAGPEVRSLAGMMDGIEPPVTPGCGGSTRSGDTR